MFDIGFSEILVIAVVALIVIGPERLPGVARTLGHLFGRMQRYVNDVKADIQREVELDELKKLRQTVEDSARSIEQSVNQEVDQAQQALRDIETAVNPVAEPPSGSESSQHVSADGSGTAVAAPEAAAQKSSDRPAV